MKNGVVAIHGYNPNEANWEPVARSRLEKGLEVYEVLGCGELIISGGVKYCERTEAQVMEELLNKIVAERGITKPNVRLEDRSTTTVENTKNLTDYLSDEKIDYFVGITSQDHAPRVFRDWAARGPEILKKLLVAGAHVPYSGKPTSDVVIAEPRHPYIGVLRDLSTGLYKMAKSTNEEIEGKFKEILVKHRQ